MTQTPPQIHPTALISPESELAPGVVIGAFAILEGKVELGPGCIIHPRGHLLGPLTMGKNNQIGSNAILGEQPQHLQYQKETSRVVIGSDNVFRENVTVHRGTTATGVTRIGNGNHFMTGAHVAHDCEVGNRCFLDNGALLGGHSVLRDDVYLGPHSAVHQHCCLGRLAVLGIGSATTKDIPPFIVQQERNAVVGINEEGMRRVGMDEQQIAAMRRVYDFVFCQGLPLREALARVEAECGPLEVIQEFAAFVQQSRRGGINRVREEPPAEDS
jgi:UDP-N-acetylglucosamine acyltransferase